MVAAPIDRMHVTLSGRNQAKRELGEGWMATLYPLPIDA